MKMKSQQLVELMAVDGQPRFYSLQNAPIIITLFKLYVTNLQCTIYPGLQECGTTLKA